MKVRAKMTLVQKNNVISPWKSPGQVEPNKPTCTVILQPVSGEANKTWAKYTPSGRIEMQIDNPDAYEAFVLGETYFVDFTIAPATEAEEK